MSFTADLSPFSRGATGDCRLRATIGPLRKPYAPFLFYRHHTVIVILSHANATNGYMVSTRLLAFSAADVILALAGTIAAVLGLGLVVGRGAPRFCIRSCLLILMLLSLLLAPTVPARAQPMARADLLLPPIVRPCPAPGRTRVVDFTGILYFGRANDGRTAACRALGPSPGGLEW